MTVRTTRRSMTFARPFVLAGLEGMQPAGTYTVETDEELLDTILTPAYRRIATVLHLPATPNEPGVSRMVTIDPQDLDAAWERDRADAPSNQAGPG